MGCSFCKDAPRRLRDKRGSSSPSSSTVLTSIVHHLSHPNDKPPKTLYNHRETKRVRYNRDSEGNKTINGYVHQKKLGLGSFGKVALYLCADNNQLYAIKSMKKRMLMKKRFGIHSGRTHWDDVMREIAIMERLDHPNVIKIHEVINDPTDNKIHIIMEYAEGGPLFKGEDAESYIRVMDDQTIRNYFSQMINGLQYIHSMNVIHRDLKPENILTHNGVVKIADFGVSYYMAQGDQNFSSDMDPVDDCEMLKKTVGSPAFLPPELCANDCDRVTGPPIDVWAIGVTLYFLYFGKIPFNGDTEALLYENVRTHEIQFPPESGPELRDLLTRLLQKNPEKRITLQQAKEHPWVRT